MRQLCPLFTKPKPCEWTKRAKRPYCAILRRQKAQSKRYSDTCSDRVSKGSSRESPLAGISAQPRILASLIIRAGLKFYLAPSTKKGAHEPSVGRYVL